MKPLVKSAVGPLMLIAVLRAGLLASGTDGRQGPVPGAAISNATLRVAAASLSLESSSRADVSGGSNEKERVPLTPVECVGRRRDVERTMQHDDPAIQRALMVLGQAVNPIRVAGAAQIRQMYARTPGAGAPSAGLDAFRAPGDTDDPNIYVNVASVVYTSAARRPSALALLKLAATLVHEQVHNTDGEFAAYRLQADFVRSKVKTIPRHQQEEVHLYVQVLDARALARQNGGRRAVCGLRFP